MSNTLTCTLIQSNLHWEDVAANLHMFEAKIASITTAKQVVLLPEMFTTGFSMQPEKLAEPMDGLTVNWMLRMAQQHRIILAGSVMIRENDTYFNRFLWVQPNGQIHYYDKRHLFAYGGEHEHYTAGNQRVIVQVNGWKILLQICYDLRFPVWARQQTDTLLYDAIVYVANWPERRSHAWRTLLQARAIENQCYVIGVNRVGSDGNGVPHIGDSMVADALGTVCYHQQHVEDIHTITLDKTHLEQLRTQLPFLKDADAFTLIHHDE